MAARPMILPSTTNTTTPTGTSFLSRNDGLVPFLSIVNQPKRSIRASASITSLESGILFSPSGDSNPHSVTRKRRDSENTIDFWMRESVPDIVQNLRKAPLLVQIYNTGENEGEGTVEIQAEKAKPWPCVKCEWGIRSPNAVVFVQELGKVESDFEERIWGILVQEKMAAIPKCYLLKTHTVVGGLDLGFECTHFCLTNATNLRESAFEQIQNHWIVDHHQ